MTHIMQIYADIHGTRIMQIYAYNHETHIMQIYAFTYVNWPLSVARRCTRV